MHSDSSIMAVFGLSFFSLVFLPLRHGEGMRTYRCRVTSSGDVHVCGVRKCASSTRQTGWWLAQRRSPALAEQRKVKVLPFIAKVGPASLSPRPFTRAGEGASSPVIPRGKPVCIQAAGSVAARVSVTLSLCPERADVRRPNDFRCLRPPFRSRRVGSVGGPLDHRAASVYVLARVIDSPVCDPDRPSLLRCSLHLQSYISHIRLSSCSVNCGCDILMRYPWRRPERSRFVGTTFKPCSKMENNEPGPVCRTVLPSCPFG